MKNEVVTYRKLFDVEVFEGILSSHKYPWHFHDSYIVVIVDSGAMEYVFREDSVVVEQGQVFVVNPFVAHYNAAVDQKCCIYRVIFLPVRLFNGSADEQSLLHFEKSTNAAVYTEMGDLFKRLKSTDNQTAHSSILHEIYCQLLKGFKSEKNCLVPDERIMPVIAYIHNHLDGKLTIQQLSGICNLSHYHFQRIFRKNTGLTVHEYIQQKRMELGRTLLRKGVKPVFTSLETGFFDQSHFHRQFKKMYVLTPAYLSK